jgi:hypothetical protein
VGERPPLDRITVAIGAPPRTDGPANRGAWSRTSAEIDDHLHVIALADGAAGVLKVDRKGVLMTRSMEDARER